MPHVEIVRYKNEIWLRYGAFMGGAVCDALGTLKQQVAIGDRIHSMSFGDKGGGMQRASSGQVLIRWVDRVANWKVLTSYAFQTSLASLHVWSQETFLGTLNIQTWEPWCKVDASSWNLRVYRFIITTGQLTRDRSALNLVSRRGNYVWRETNWLWDKTHKTLQGREGKKSEESWEYPLLGK